MTSMSARSLTGHELGDLVLPAAMQLAGAVRTGRQRDIDDAIAAAYQDSGYHPHWRTALILVLAGLVPDECRPSELLDWNHQDARR